MKADVDRKFEPEKNREGVAEYAQQPAHDIKCVASFHLTGSMHGRACADKQENGGAFPDRTGFESTPVANFQSMEKTVTLSSSDWKKFTEAIMTTRVLVPLAEGVEEMEAVIIIDTLRRAGWKVDAVGLRSGVVEASRGVKLVPDKAWIQIDPEDYHVIALPGGNGGTQNLMADERVLSALRRHYRAGKLTAAVCAAPLVLQKAGIIDQKRVTCHPGAIAGMTAATRVDERVVVDGNVVTSQGPGTTFAFALTIIAIIDGREKADEVARAMVVSPAETR